MGPLAASATIAHVPLGARMFKPVLLSLAIVALFLEGAVAQSFAPTIVVDEAHNGIGHATNPDEYQIPAASGLIVDPGSYTFPLRADFKGVDPDALYLIAGVNRKYMARWHGPPDRTVLDATTLNAQPGSEPFRGFAAGDRLIIAIGIDRRDRNTLEAMWFGMVSVK
jgi:hypothetical protein